MAISLFFGNMIWLKNEKQMHFFTAFFGGGPAYISLFLETLSKILFHKGFDEKISRQLVSYLANGTVELAEMNNLRYGDIVKKDQTIAELDSDKATLDLPAEA